MNEAAGVDANWKRLQDAGNNPQALAAIYHDPQTPDWMRSAAGDTAVKLLEHGRAQEQVQKEVTQAIKSGDMRSIDKTIKEGGDKGNLVKALLFNFIGFHSGAQAEVAKMNLPGEWKSTYNPDTNEYGMVQYSTHGKPLQGFNSDNTPMTAEQLAAHAAGGGMAKNMQVSMTPHQAMVNGELHTFSTRRVGNNIQYKDDTAGGGWSNQAPAGLTTMGQAGAWTRGTHQSGVSAMNQTMNKMRTANTQATSIGGAPVYTEDQIQAAGHQAYSGVTGIQYGTAQPGQALSALPAAPAAPAATTAAPAPAAAAAANQTTAPVNPAAATPATTTPAATPIKSIAQQVLDGDIPFPTGHNMVQKQAMLNQVNALAQEQGKIYDQGLYKRRNETESKFTTGKQGDTVRSMNVAIDHLDTLQQAANALNNGQLPIFNSIANDYAKRTGQAAPTNFESVKSLVADEVTKAIMGGATALGDREKADAAINAAQSPQQLAGVINQYQHLMAGQLSGLKQQYESGGGRNWDSKISDRSNQVLGNINKPADMIPGTNVSQSAVAAEIARRKAMKE
jgi:hypothetical protein